MRALTAPTQVEWPPSHTAQRHLALVDSMSSDRHGGDFGDSIESHRAHLLRVALRLSGNQDVASDLVQETLLRALRRRDQFRIGTDIGTWLVTILTNLYFDYLKHLKVERRAEPALAASDAAEDTSLLSTIPDAKLYAAIQALEPELREVVELCYLQQLRYRDAAQRLNLPIGTVGTRLKRAREILHVLLTADEDPVKP
jgi:RNA polymerase sigma-70 factor (ECF subfamily)